MNKVISKNGFVLIRRDDAASKVGSILIPDSAKKVTDRGTVISAGKGREENGQFVPCEVEPGDRVLFQFYGAVAVKLEVDKKKGVEELVFLPYHAILAKIEEA